MQPIAHIHTDFPTKFGVPRQSGLVDRLTSAIVFEPEFRNPDYLRGIEGWSHLWLIWQFHCVAPDDYSPTVLPPKLGGKTRVGVFATRSPFRPNHMGLSVVRLASVDWTAKGGPVLYVTGADMVDGTPIFDIKPYVPYADSVPDAVDAFAGNAAGRTAGGHLPGTVARDDRAGEAGGADAGALAQSSPRLSARSHAALRLQL